MIDAGLEARAAEVGECLLTAGAMLATAESCTGGLIAAALTAIPGSSRWFERGFVTYSYESKVELLGVDAAVLAAQGAVSEAVARAMATGALAASRADAALAVTGIAGPGGATVDKPVGLVWFAWARRDGVGWAEARRYAGDRAAVRHQSALHALAGVAHLVRHSVA